MHIRKSNICASKLDAQETGFSFTQFNIFGSLTFVPESWTCKKQTSVSHCSIESEEMSLDAGPRMDGIPAFDLLDFFLTQVLHSSSNQPRARGNLLRDKHCEKHSHERRKKQTNTSEDLGVTNLDYVTPNTKFSRFEK